MLMSFVRRGPPAAAAAAWRTTTTTAAAAAATTAARAGDAARGMGTWTGVRRAEHLRAAAAALERHGADALRPRKVRGVWRKPAVSARKAAALRKQARRAGAYREELPADFAAPEGAANVVHFKPSWDARGKTSLPGRPVRKGKHLERRARRVAEVEAQLAKQDGLIKAHRKALADAKPKTFFDKMTNAPAPGQ
jgi:hypothetical protein